MAQLLVRWGVLAVALAATLALARGDAGTAAAPAAAALKAGFAAYRGGDYRGARDHLRLALEKKPLNEPWARFLLAESEFYEGAYGAARTDFERVARAHAGRIGEMAPFRAADCLWMDGDRAAARKAYEHLLKKATPTTADVALIRFRVADQLADRDPAAARRQYLAIAREFPAHPLADEALRRSGPMAPGRPASAVSKIEPPAPAADLSPTDRLRRADALTKDRHWDEALAELDRLPANLPDPLAAERDYQIGMTKFHMRRG